MNSPRANHFGNPIITATVGSKNSAGLHKAPPSPVGSTFSKNDLNKTISKQSLEHLCLSFGSRGSMPSSSSYQHQALSPNLSFSERETLSQNETSFLQHSPNESIKLVGSTITTDPTIGLPSHYPGSAGHQRVGSLESSVLLEELQDFDDIFEQGQTSTHHYKPTHDSDNDENERESALPTRRQDDYDEDELQSFSRSLPTRFSFQHRRNISELSGLSISTPPPQIGTTEKYKIAPRSNSW
eukprot:CAMPEP_0116141776 /NCGR_PEP_ID=MMETSP0329-20121206/14557_1 /TAXON_ID=697910 /ORGANISM="Pseudo-nitzschia arenysensis, Strain B593" /LENGTH=240 /DNA_ID=CAMNT_0003636971 /DNA_START=234 /DNA_END=953 /DNA_ORIENTATION=-